MQFHRGASYQNTEVYEVKTGVQRLRCGCTKKTDPTFFKKKKKPS